MDKNCTLVKVINYNACTKLKLKDDKGVEFEKVTPSKYLGLKLDDSEKFVPIGCFKDFHEELLGYFAVNVIIGDKDNPKFRENKPKQGNKK